ncbi:MAG: UMP kinase, partial [Promethearchaeota archaeon]
MKKNIVIKIGGSLIFTEDKIINSKKISEFCKILKEESDFDKIVVVCGGGIIARDYINAVRSFKGSEMLCDTFGIDISRINSKLIVASLKDEAYP